MAKFNFPTSPSTNQTYTANSVTWKWNGHAWKRTTGVGAPTGPQGAQGHQGVQGAQGATGAQGHQGNPNAFPSGTMMMFVQQNAPTGWTKSTANNNRALRIVSGTSGGNQGGNNEFTAVFTSSRGTTGGNVGNHTLTTAQIPSHRHWVSRARRDDNNFSQWNTNTQEFGLYSDAGSYSASDQNHSVGRNTAYTGSGQAHGHSFTHPVVNLDVRYVDAIICSKD